MEAMGTPIDLGGKLRKIWADTSRILQMNLSAIQVVRKEIEE